LNESIPQGTEFYGVPHPGTFVINRDGKVVAKYFEQDYRDRYTAGNILLREFGAGGAALTTVETPHLKLTYRSADALLSPGDRTTLTIDIDLKPRMHLYAPGVEGYIPVDWAIPESNGGQAHPVTYPPARRLRLPVIDEIVPVYERRLRLLRDFTVGQMNEMKAALSADRMLTVEGVFRYQACDDKECYLPQTIPLKWTFQIEPADSQRVPEEMQRKRSR
jgi:hypothetical protein